MFFSVDAQYQQKPVSISTPWASSINESNAWQEYPRPQLVREEWKNLNGLWDYAVVNKGTAKPASFQGKILVPYCIESSLSGVQKSLSPKQELWYNKEINVPADWKGKNIILHFGAVDWQSDLYVNGKHVGQHTGGSDPFSYDITTFLNTTGVQKIALKVFDPTDSDIQPRGKQTLNPRGFWYTAVSGIWQTVWMEPVNTTSISVLNPVADIDNGIISFNSNLNNSKGDEQAEIEISYHGKQIKKIKTNYLPNLKAELNDIKLWSPEQPNLYQVKMIISRNEKKLDQFDSYFAMRKISLGEDKNGFTRIELNNKPYFQWGTLDQGWWPESLLTPPSDKAMKYDMEMLKSMGFNMIRKHIKLEPARYYYHADTMGMLLWQDMPTGFISINDPQQHVKFDAEKDWDRPEASAKDFKAEWKSIMDNLRFFPSIVVWVPFNEGWGQFQTKEVTDWTQKYDKDRLVDATSGWTDRGVGNMFDAHQYPGPSMEPTIQNKGRAVVLGEFGGLGWPVKGHLWNEDKRNWGYRTYFDKSTFHNEFSKVINNLYPLLSRGLSAAIYTQTSDVEGEVNGLITYDRKFQKITNEEMYQLSQPLFETVKKANFVINDSEIKNSTLLISQLKPADGWNLHNPFDAHFKSHEGPYSVKKGEDLWAVNSFIIKGKPEKMAMKLLAQGDLKIYLNGTEIYNNKILTKRHYDEFNISDYQNLLKEGKNVLGFELKNSEADSQFDFGLYNF
ncbi:hypothetical protein A5893_05075 [Pedobacter psychrophilus]|uniref:Beta-galactosidase n=1 Tax=Pedobacter psychrophilus TaxID=1826909 RepID=A0A179DGX0_9SPHI|nr:sugar-binding domain-containing protein [Pedobacter psychrophilus]OAQ40326.1 hypothetical protein A5893_05075 [Pedobacter psychrophilus]